MIRKIKYPFTELSTLEIKRLEEFKTFHNVNYEDLYVYYTTEGTVGVGYCIIVSLTPVKKNTYDIDFGSSARDITDIDNLIDNF